MATAPPAAVQCPVQTAARHTLRSRTPVPATVSPQEGHSPSPPGRRPRIRPPPRQAHRTAADTPPRTRAPPARTHRPRIPVPIPPPHRRWRGAHTDPPKGRMPSRQRQMRRPCGGGALYAACPAKPDRAYPRVCGKIRAALPPPAPPRSRLPHRRRRSPRHAAGAAHSRSRRSGQRFSR